MEKMTTEDIYRRKTPVVRVVMFLAAFFALLLIVTYLFRPYSIDRAIVSGYYAEPKNSLDVVYIGGSACFVFWAPMVAWKEYGIPSYDFGVNTIPADALKYCIKEVLKTQSPKLIILDIRPFQYRDSEQPVWEVPVRNITDSMAYSLNRASLIDSVVRNKLKTDETEYQLDIAKYHSRWKALGESSFQYIFNNREFIDKGFYFVPKYEKQVYQDLRNVTDTLPVSDETNALLIDLLQYCRTLNTKILFVTNSYVETEEHRKVYNYLKAEVNAYGFDYINTNDYNGEMGLDYSRDLYNIAHVNIFGAEKYTTFLGKYIAEKYSLEDKRGDPGYSSWNDDYTVWEGEVANIKAIINDQITKDEQAKQ